ncbi:MAG: DUF4404 family protein [Gammaproteobacteria bacterium]
MSEQALKDLLTRLHGELHTASALDADTLSLVRKLDTDIKHILASAPAATETESIAKRAAALESRFAVNHPVAEQIIREIINTLARIGV